MTTPKPLTFPNTNHPLPPGNSPSLQLTQPSTLEQYTHTLANSQEWKGALSVEAYVRREEHLANQDLTRNGGITFWVLVDTDEPVAEGANRTVLAGCETIRKEALVSQNGTVEDVTCHGVASVFSPNAFRGRGYGERLIRELGERLRTWQCMKGRMRCSVLFSDIGKKFYAKNGWHPYDARHVHLPPAPSAAKQTLASSPISHSTTKHPELLQSSPSTSTATLIKAPDLPYFCALATSRIKHSLLTRSDQNSPALAILPTHAKISWLLAREDFVSHELLGRSPDVKGAWIQPSKNAINTDNPIETISPNPGYRSDTSQDDRIFAIFSRMFANPDPSQRKGNTLHILHLSLPPQDSDSDPSPSSDSDSKSEITQTRSQGIIAILRIAQSQARQWNMEVVELWNPSKEVVDVCRSIVTSAREGRGGGAAEGGGHVDGDGNPYGDVVERQLESLPCLRWFGDGESRSSRSENASVNGRTGSGIGKLGIEAATGKVQGLKWFANEKFGWC